MIEDLANISPVGRGATAGREAITEPVATMASIANKEPAVTPMMAQYRDIKAANPGCLLFYRMGDFYELFFDDAVIAARDLGITLTTRGKHLGNDIPMCGVPVHAADQYLLRLIATGHRVAVCEQTEAPAQARRRGPKSVVRREVARLVTPGTLTEEALLDPAHSNYLAAVARLRQGTSGDLFALSWVDISTGEFRVAEGDRDFLASELARITPSEIIVATTLFDDPDLRHMWDPFGTAVTPLAPAYFESTTAGERLTAYFGVASLEAFGEFSRVARAAAAAVLAYIEKTQIGGRPPLRPLSSQIPGGAMVIDGATRRNLELTRTLSGEKQGSLLAAINQTLTGGGARLLERRLASPLTDPELIEQRLSAVAWLLGDEARRDAIRQILKSATDLPRAVTRLTLDRGGPRDLAAIRAGLGAGLELAEVLAEGPPEAAEITDVVAALIAAPGDLQAHLAAALKDDVPHLKRDGGFVRDGFNARLDDERSLRDHSRKLIAKMQAEYAAEADIRNLRIKHNNVLGYFIEVGAGHADKMLSPPLSERFVHRQTLASAVRFTTTDLVELEQKISGAGDRALAIELATYETLVADVVACANRISAVANALAVLDVTAGLAVLALNEGYVRPEIDHSLAFDIRGGRHPVVDQALRDARESEFVANSCDLGPPKGADAGRIWLVTGPNMAGKSTFLRQNALIAIMAQMGSFVPAEAAHVGAVDRLFSRVGAADDLARGRSTFMVEMVETAAILNLAGPRSLVILDEIGRGTATFDGLSIAWAAIEHLHETNRSRALFATHYHELTALAQRLSRLENMTVRVKEWEDDVVFLHEIAPGSADRSYGIQVARLAGLPATVVSRARRVLAQLEETDRGAPVDALIDDLPLFSARAEVAPVVPGDPVGDLLAEVSPDELTPREALELIYRLKVLKAGRGA
jgi:DNA mismatch repair protein MutS